MKISKAFWLALYYGFARYLPVSYAPVVGRPSKWLRAACCRHIFLKCGKNVNIERGAYFASGSLIEIGDESGLGVKCHIPYNSKIGNFVMMGPNCRIVGANHRFDRLDVPMCQQSDTPVLQTVIDDDVWIGRDVLIMPGRHISKGSIIAGGCVLTKDFPPYAIVGGNPSQLLRYRTDKS